MTANAKVPGAFDDAPRRGDENHSKRFYDADGDLTANAIPRKG